MPKPQARWFFVACTAFTAILVFLRIDTLREITTHQNQDRMTESMVHGKHIFDRNNCMGCHTILREGVYYAPELTKVVKRRSAQWIVLFLEDPEAMLPGGRRIIKYDFAERDIRDVIAFIGRMARSTPTNSSGSTISHRPSPPRAPRPPPR